VEKHQQVPVAAWSLTEVGLTIFCSKKTGFVVWANTPLTLSTKAQKMKIKRM
jgi:hypothetical protein